MEQAERSLGQLFLFDDAETSILKPAEDLVLESLTLEWLDPAPEQLTLFSGTKAVAEPETPEETAALDAMFEAAARAKPKLDALTREIAAQFQGASPVIPPTLKGRARSLDKVRNDYNGDATKLKDLARSTIETRDLAQAKAVVAELERRTGTRAKRNLFEQNPIDGYRDALFNLVIDGHTVEVQVHVPEILTTKHHLHHAYVVRTGVERKSWSAGREPTLDEWLRIDRMNRIMRRGYNTALGLNPYLGASPEELARRQAKNAGTSSSASSGFTRNPPLALMSSSEMGRGVSSSKAQPLPAASRTTANASARNLGSGTSMNPVAPGNLEGFIMTHTITQTSNNQGVNVATRRPEEQLTLFIATKRSLYSKAAKEKHLRPITRMLVKLRSGVQHGAQGIQPGPPKKQFIHRSNWLKTNPLHRPRRLPPECSALAFFAFVIDRSNIARVSKHCSGFGSVLPA